MVKTTVSKAKKKWAENLAAAVDRWKAEVSRAEDKYCEGLALFASDGASTSLDLKNNWKKGVERITAEDFQNAVKGKEDYWAQRIKEAVLGKGLFITKKEKSNFHFKLRSILFENIKSEFYDMSLHEDEPPQTDREKWTCCRPDIELLSREQTPAKRVWIEIETDPIEVLHKLARLILFCKIENFPKPTTLIFGIPEKSRSHRIRIRRVYGEKVKHKVGERFEDVFDKFISTIRELNEILQIEDLRLYSINPESKIVNLKLKIVKIS